MKDVQSKFAQYGNGEAIQGSINALSPVYRNASLGSSTDPFAAKTNKYAETGCIMIQALAQGIYVKFSASGTAASAAADNHYIPAGGERIFFVNNASKYIRIIEAAGGATSFVTELY